MKKYHFIDLFAGAGGLSEGFVRAGLITYSEIKFYLMKCANSARKNRNFKKMST